MQFIATIASIYTMVVSAAAAAKLQGEI